MVLDYTPVPSKEDILKGELIGHTLDERKKRLRADILSSFAHETAHMHPFFKNHGNEKTANMWEQEQICVYIGEKTRGDISNILFEKGILTENLIDSFNLNNGEDDNIVANYFYPFLIKEYGLEKVRGIWKNLQEDSDIERVIEKNLNKNSKDIEADFKKKIKDRDYLKNIYN
jgi:hypothetical protein